MSTGDVIEEDVSWNSLSLTLTLLVQTMHSFSASNAAFLSISQKNKFKTVIALIWLQVKGDCNVINEYYY